MALKNSAAAALSLWLSAGAASAAPAPAPEQKGPQPSPWSICMADVQTPEILASQGFIWMKDDALARRLSGDLAAYYVCLAKTAKLPDPCAAIDKVARTYRYKNEIGQMKAQCAEFGRYADFYSEVVSAKRNARVFPGCYRHLRTLGSPMKIFNVDAVAPPEAALGDKTNDGKFWNVCQWIGNAIKDGKRDFCADPRVKHFLAAGLDMNFWKMACGSAARLWVDGDPGFCSILPHQGGACPVWADFTRAYRGKDASQCPAGPAQGLCVAALAGGDKDACIGIWEKVQGQYCDERSKYRLEDLPKKPKGAPRQGAGKG